MSAGISRYEGIYMDFRPIKRKTEEDIGERKKPYDPDEEETYLYDIHKPMEFINEGENGVFDITKQTGINTAKSVFDKYTSFKT